MTEHKHYFEKVCPGADYSRCAICGAMRHDLDGDILEDVRYPTYWKKDRNWNWVPWVLFMAWAIVTILITILYQRAWPLIK